MKKKKCPNCNSTKIIRIVYGYPSAEAGEKAEKGLIKLGGCCVDESSPQWHCKNCEQVTVAEQSQKFVHELINGVKPNKWDNQLKDELALEVIYERKWKLLQSGTGNGFSFDLIPHT